MPKVESGAGSVGQGDSIYALNAPPFRAENVMNHPSPIAFAVHIVPGLLTTLLSSGITPGMAYGALAKIQNPWRRRRTLPEGV